MAWVSLIIAGLLEVVWAIALKKSNGFTEPVASAVFGVAALASFLLLAEALQTLPRHDPDQNQQPVQSLDSVPLVLARRDEQREAAIDHDQVSSGSSACSLTSVSASSSAGTESRTMPSPA
jgi:hypothetical protein